MAKKQNIKTNKINQDDGEIDLSEIFIKLMRWKWLITSMVVLITVTTFLYVKFSPGPPITYTAKAVLKIGTVGTFHVQSPEMIVNSLITGISATSRSEGYTISEIRTPSKTNFVTVDNISQVHMYHFIANVIHKNNKFILTLIIKATNQTLDISVQTPHAQGSKEIAQIIGNYIIEKHHPLYANAIKQAQIELAEIKKMAVYVNNNYIKMKLMYENQKYPTSYTLEPYEPSAPDPSPGKRILLKTAFAFTASLFFSIILIYFIEYMLAIGREMKERTEKN
ncbi:MAG: hypothetical protein KA807_09025 [Prolixibacteraceae bacterium]|nr:hypothetical protein [Prolixibacteraceae bacterium]